MDRKNPQIKKTLGAALLLTSCGLVGVATLGGVAAADHECTTERYSWQNPTLSQIATWNLSLGTGLTIPAPAAGETLTVLGTSYVAYDAMPEGEVTREVQNETGERFGLRVGGAQVGSLSADLPDSVSQGAATPWFSGLVAGSLGGAGSSTAGGAIVVQHSGQSETSNAFSVKSFVIEVERCARHETTTTEPEDTTTTAPGSTTTTPTPVTTTPVTTTPVTTTPVTTAPVVTTTTLVASGGPTTTVATGGGGAVTTVPGGSLPVTGGDMTFPLILAGLAAGTGAALMMVRRKATPNT